MLPSSNTVFLTVIKQMRGFDLMRYWFNLGLSAVVGGLLMLGVAPSLFRGAVQTVWAQGVVDGEAIPDEVVEQFAKVVLALEPFRIEALEQTNNTTDRSSQNEIRREFIRQATEVIESFEMTVPDYNRITIQLRDDAELKTRIEDAIRTIQQEEA